MQANLLSCIVQILRNDKSEANDDEEEVDYISVRKECEQLINSFVKRMANCDLEDFELVIIFGASLSVRV